MLTNFEISTILSDLESIKDRRMEDLTETTIYESVFDYGVQQFLRLLLSNKTQGK